METLKNKFLEMLFAMALWMIFVMFVVSLFITPWAIPLWVCALFFVLSRANN